MANRTSLDSSSKVLVLAWVDILTIAVVIVKEMTMVRGCVERV